MNIQLFPGFKVVQMYNCEKPIRVSFGCHDGLVLLGLNITSSAELSPPPARGMKSGVCSSYCAPSVCGSYQMSLAPPAHLPLHIITQNTKHYTHFTTH